ncbi:MAG: hypothetical protein ACRD47_04865 [Nitrososphaeraceae archaeon]
MSKTKNPIQTESITIRMPKDILNALRTDSSRNLESLNTGINRILSLHVKWYRHASDARLIYFSKDFLVSLMGKVKDGDLTELLDTQIGESFDKSATMMTNGLDPLNLLDLIDTWLIVSGFRFQHELYDNCHRFKIRLEMGEKWSKFFAALFEYILKRVRTKDHQIKIIEDILILDIYV